MITIVGEAPGPRSEGLAPFEGPSGRRLKELLGPGLTSQARMINLLGFHPVDSFPLRAAALVARYLPLEGTILLLGRQVAAAFGLRDLNYFSWHFTDEAEISVIPHPSGRNRWWNDEINVEEATVFFELLQEELNAAQQGS